MNEEKAETFYEKHTKQMGWWNKKLRENCGGETLKFKIEKIKKEKNET